MARTDEARTPNTLGDLGGFAGVGSASAQAARQEAGLEEIPQGEDRGSTLDAGQADVKPDSEGPQEPTGLQAEPAQFTNTGSVIANMVASPTGPVPVSLVAGSPEDAARILEERREQVEQEKEARNPDRRFSEDEVNMLDGGELRAIGARRGYDMPGAGTRSARAAFLRQQAKDENLGDDEVPTPRRRRKAADADA